MLCTHLCTGIAQTIFRAILAAGIAWMQFSVTIDNTLRIVAITNRAETLTICIINTEWTGFMLLNGLGGLAYRIGAGAE